MDTSLSQSTIPLQIKASAAPPLQITGGEVESMSSMGSKEKELESRNPKRRKSTAPVEKLGTPKGKEARIEGGEGSSIKELEERAKYLVPGFAVNIIWCKSSKFVEFLEILEHQHWVKLVGDFAKNHIYPDAIREFCESFKYHNGNCSSVVNGTSLSFGADYVANLFEVPNEGFDVYFKGKYKVEIRGAKNSDILASIGGTENSITTHQDQFSPLQKLLFNLVRRLIIPRTQKRSEANLRDATLMYCLENKIQINFPALMIKHLNHCIPDLKIGYGSFLTSIFQSFSIDLSKYEALPLKPEQILNGETLLNLGLKVVNGKTVFEKGVEKTQDVEVEEDEEMEKKEGEVPDVVNEVPKIWMVVPKGKRKSRPAAKEVKNPGPPAFVDISREEGDGEGKGEDTEEFHEEAMGQDTPPRNKSPVPKKKSAKVLKKTPPVPKKPAAVPIETGTPSASTDVPSDFVGFALFSGFGVSSSNLDLKKLELEVHGVKELVTSMSSSQSSLDARITSLQTSVDNLINMVSDLHKGFASLQQNVTSSQETILKRIEELAFEEVPETEPKPTHDQSA